MKARRQYVETLLGRYLRSRKHQKGKILDEFCRNTGQNRKYVIRRLSEVASGRTRLPRKRRRRYGREVQGALKTLWTIFDFPCGQRLCPLIRRELGRLRELGELSVSEETAVKLGRVSPATIDRLLRPEKQAWKACHRRGSPGLIAKKIPLRMGEWRDVRVGQVDMDLVLHCGSSTSGEYGHSLSTLDILSEWWEAEVVMGRAQVRIFNALKEIAARSPFPWVSIHSDNDSAFVNDLLYRYTQEKEILFTRSRPYLRYDTPSELAIIQDLYRHELRLYKNFFQPVMKLARKERVGGRPKRSYDLPRTPYQRLLESGRLSTDKARELRDLYLSLNPADLKRRIDKKLTSLYELYQKKKKTLVTVNPYKKQEPSMVTFLLSEQPQFRLPG